MPTYTVEIDYSGQTGYGNWWGYSGSYTGAKGGFTMPGTGFRLGQIGVYKYRNSGSNPYAITAYLYSESGGNPSSLLQTSDNTVNVNDLTTSSGGAEYLFQFAGYDLVASTKYIVVLGISGIYATTYPRFQMGASGAGWNYSTGRGVFPVSGGGTNLPRLKVYSQPAGGGGGGPLFQGSNFRRRVA